MCKGKKHCRPVKNAWSYIDNVGNPTKDLGFDERCPLAAIEMIWQCQLEEDEPKRDYPNWVKKSSKSPGWFGPLNIGDPTLAGLKWMESQGLDMYDHNSGRKALAGWCKKLSVPYTLSVHLHGDLYDVWNKYYQKDLRESAVKIRDQSRDPQVATAALRVFAKYCGRGIDPYTPPMTLVERQNHLLIQHHLGSQVASNVLMGLPIDEEPVKNEFSDSSDEDRPNVPFRPPPVRKRKRIPGGARPARECRKRAPPIVPRNDSNEPPRKRRRRRNKKLSLPARAVRPLLRQSKKKKKPSWQPQPLRPLKVHLRKTGNGYRVVRKRRKKKTHLKIRLRKVTGGYRRVVVARHW